MAARSLLEEMAEGEFEEIVHLADRASGLRAIVAIHSTVLGPSLGGTRCYAYRSEQAALTDVMRLARAMTYKNAVAGLDFGGGKAVIIGDPATVRTEALLRAYGRFIDSLGGRYLTAEDIGTTQADMDLIRQETTRVTGISPSLGGSGDPSEATAWGVRCAMHAVAAALGGDTLAGLRVVVSGVGKVGGALIGHLVGEGAEVTVADVNAVRAAETAQRWPVASVAPSEAHRTPCDIFAPCAMGAVLSPETIAELACRAVVGAANNQLADPHCALLLDRRGVIYAPDFVVNAGGVINISEETAGYDHDRAWARVARIQETTATVLSTAAAQGITTSEAADRLAEARIAAASPADHPRSFPAT